MKGATMHMSAQISMSGPRFCTALEGTSVRMTKVLSAMCVYMVMCIFIEICCTFVSCVPAGNRSSASLLVDLQYGAAAASPLLVRCSRIYFPLRSGLTWHAWVTLRCLLEKLLQKGNLLFAELSLFQLAPTAGILEVTLNISSDDHFLLTLHVQDKYSYNLEQSLVYFHP